MTNHNMGVHIQIENSPRDKMQHFAQSGNGTKSAECVEPIDKGNHGKGRLDPPGGRNAGRRKGGHHTVAVLA